MGRGTLLVAGGTRCAHKNMLVCIFPYRLHRGGRHTNQGSSHSATAKMCQCRRMTWEMEIGPSKKEDGVILRPRRSVHRSGGGGRGVSARQRRRQKRGRKRDTVSSAERVHAPDITAVSASATCRGGPSRMHADAWVPFEQNCGLLGLGGVAKDWPMQDKPAKGRASR